MSFGGVVFWGAPYVPSHKKQLIKAFSKLYPLSENDCLVDLGSGDGVVLRVARSYRAKAVGYELNPFLAFFTRLRSFYDAGVSVRLVDYTRLKALPPEATVVYAFTTDRDIKIIEKKLLQWSEHQPLYFVSYGFVLPNIPIQRRLGPMSLYMFEKS